MNSKLKKTLLAFVATYGVTLAGMYFKQRQLLYNAPKKTLIEDKPLEIIFHEGDQPSLLGWVLNPDQDNALIYFGGASESIEMRMGNLKQTFPNHSIYLVPYRGFGPNAQHVHEEAAIKSDCCRLMRSVAKKHGLENVDVIGRSLGTGMAVHVASKFNVSRVCLVTPYDSILEVARQRYLYLFPLGSLLRDKFETWKDASAVKSNILVLSAEKDLVTPISRWKRLRTFLTEAASVEHYFIPKSNHTNIMDQSETWKLLRNYLSTNALKIAQQLVEHKVEAVDQNTLTTQHNNVTETLAEIAEGLMHQPSPMPHIATYTQMSSASISNTQTNANEVSAMGETTVLQECPTLETVSATVQSARTSKLVFTDLDMVPKTIKMKFK